MNSFDVAVFAWLTSAVLASAIGYSRGRAADAMNLGILLGPIGLLLAIMLLPGGRFPAKEAIPVLPLGDTDGRQPVAADARLRRAA